jgi:hypothetical protein
MARVGTAAATTGRRVRPEFVAGVGQYYPPYGQISRGVAPGFSRGSGCIGAFDTASLVFSTTADVTGLDTLTSTAFLPTVTRLAIASTDIAQAHITAGAYTTPSGIIVSQLSFQLAASGKVFPTSNTMAQGETYNALSVIGTAVIFAPTKVSGGVTFTVPITIAFLGDVIST